MHGAAKQTRAIIATLSDVYLKRQTHRRNGQRRFATDPKSGKKRLIPNQSDIYNAWKQTKPALWELTDSAPDPSLESKVRGIAANQRGIIGLDNCHVRKMGLSFYVDLHIVVNGQLSVREGHRLAHKVEAEVLKALPQVSEVLVHVEPEEELAVEGQKDGRR